MKEKIVISEKKKVDKFFKKNEVLRVEPLDFHFFDKKKVIVFTPAEYVEKLTEAMSEAGAGNIGEYSMCSFRIEGTGTYLPGKKAKPFKGSKGDLSKEQEIKLEMECDPKDLNKVIDAILENHAYEEIVYEVYDFKFRDIRTNGVAVSLKKKIKYDDLLSRINKMIDISEIKENKSFKKIAVIENDFSKNFVTICEANDIDAIMSINKNKINLIIL